jgi:hypothetical protein
MEENMAQSTAQPVEEGDDEQATRSFSKKPPTTLYDNGHGTRVVRWDEGVSNLMIERSYKPKDSTEYVADRVNITPEEALGIIFGLQKGVEQSMEKVAAKNQNRARA